MRNAIIFIVLAVLAYFLFFSSGEATDPSYMRFEVQKPFEIIYTPVRPPAAFAPAGEEPAPEPEYTGPTEFGLTFIIKLPPGVICEDMTEPRVAVMDDFLDECDDCRLIASVCKDVLSPTERAYFEDTVTDRPYFSYEKGGLLPDQDFRVLFPDVSEGRAGGMCVELSKDLRRSFLGFFGGKTECVRPDE